MCCPCWWHNHAKGGAKRGTIFGYFRQFSLTSFIISAYIIHIFHMQNFATNQSTDPIKRINVGNVHFYKPWVLWNHTFLLISFKVKFLMLKCCVHDLVRFQHKKQLSRVKTNKKKPMFWLKISGFDATNTTGNCPLIFLKISSAIVLTDVATRYQTVVTGMAAVMYWLSNTAAWSVALSLTLWRSTYT